MNTIEHPNYVHAVVALAAGGVVSACADGKVRCFDSAGTDSSGERGAAVVGQRTCAIPFPSGQCVGTLSGHTDWVNALVVLPQGEMASGGDDHIVCVWSAGLASPARTSF